MTNALFKKRIKLVDAYFKENFDGTKVPFNTTKTYKVFAAQCKQLIESEHSSVSFEDYTSKKDAYQAFNKLMPSYDSLATTESESEDIWS